MWVRAGRSSGQSVVYTVGSCLHMVQVVSSIKQVTNLEGRVGQPLPFSDVGRRQRGQSNMRHSVVEMCVLHFEALAPINK